MTRTLHLLLALAAGFCLPQFALAFNVYTVGGDAACGYAFIQDALDICKPSALRELDGLATAHARVFVKVRGRSAPSRPLSMARQSTHDAEQEMRNTS